MRAMTAPSTWFQRYLLPGFVFQAAVIAGGYATGRELVEFFLPPGLGRPARHAGQHAGLEPGADGQLRAGARGTAYDYRSFFKVLLGRGWFLFEIGYFALIIIILAVMGAAAGEIAHSLFGLPKLAGSLGMIAATGLMLVYSSAAIEKFLALSVGYLYLVYFVFLVWSVLRSATASKTASRPRSGGRWLVQGRRHLRRIQRRHHSRSPVLHPSPEQPTRSARCGAARRPARHAAGRGVLHRDDGLLPGDRRTRRCHRHSCLAKLEAPWFEWAFQIAVLLTLVDTGVALLHAINERVAKAFEERGAADATALRPALAVV